MTGASPRAGHRLLPHTADVVLEAWAPTLAGCAREALLALTGSFAAVADGTPTVSRPVSVQGAAADELVVGVLEEALYVLDSEGVVPVDCDLRQDGRGLAGTFAVVPVQGVEAVGAVPKAVSWSGLTVACDGRRGRGWHCRVVVDV